MTASAAFMLARWQPYAARYRLRLVPRQQVEPEASITLHPRHVIRMTLSEHA
ncbi:MAG TPA: hypothetical protein VGB76_11470 [Pyrinomonadaceae bacterium]|jgi:hypothetical protein